MCGDNLIRHSVLIIMHTSAVWNVRKPRVIRSLWVNFCVARYTARHSTTLHYSRAPVTSTSSRLIRVSRQWCESPKTR